MYLCTCSYNEVLQFRPRFFRPTLSTLVQWIGKPCKYIFRQITIFTGPILIPTGRQKKPFATCVVLWNVKVSICLLNEAQWWLRRHIFLKIKNVVCCADERQRRIDLSAQFQLTRNAEGSSCLWVLASFPAFLFLSPVCSCLFSWLEPVRFTGRSEKYLQISISCVSSVYLKRLTYTHSGHTGIKEQWIQESTQSQVTRKAQGPPRPSST